MRKRVKWQRIIAAVLTAVMLNSTACPNVLVASAAPVQETGDEQNEIQQKNGTENFEAPETVIEDNSVEGSPVETPAGQQVYAEGSIHIYNESQLSAVGSGVQVYSGDESADTFGTGDPVTDENGSPVVYSMEASYVLMNDIPLDSNAIWQLPAGFSGSFSSADGGSSTTLYDESTDTIYMYHPYQLALMAGSEDTETEPVMSGDYDAAQFGVGQMVYPNGEDQANLTYSRSHNYMLSRYFSPEMPEMKAVQVQDEVTEQIGGRDYVGQVHKVIDGKDYILIGNEYQLREIGSGAQVTPMLYVKSETNYLTKTYTVYTPFYPGDADLNLREGNAYSCEKPYLGNASWDSSEQAYLYFSEENGNQTGLMKIDYDNDGLLGTLLGPVGNLVSGVLKAILGPLLNLPLLGDILQGIIGNATHDIVIVDDGFTYDNAEKYVSVENAGAEYKNLKYSSDANYIIFRDIDLDSDITDLNGNGNGKTASTDQDYWNPIMLSGDMLGRKNMVEGTPVTIKNVQVVQGEKIDISKTTGIGFFGTISGKQDESQLGVSSSVTLVKDINLDTVNVKSSAITTVDVDNTLISGLLEGLGGLLGGILSGVTDLLGYIIPGFENLNLGKVVEDLLSLQRDKEDTYATGSFAGRVTGYVKIDNCKVMNATVVNEKKDISGGFVGFTEGTEQYSTLSNVLGGAVSLLSKLLNILPGVGLGDLITVLLENDIPLGELIPTGYYKPVLQNCSVALADGNIGSLTTQYNGGFVGIQTGTDMSGCSVTGLETVKASNYAGGFAGLERDDTLQGSLSQLEITITPDIQSKQTNCSSQSTANGLKIETAEDYAGGFNGCMADSVSTASSVSTLQEVKAGRDYAGGFTGRATLGFSVAIGNKEEQNTLLESVGKLLVDVVAGSDSTAVDNSLLTAVGIKSSEIYGVNVAGNNLSIYAAGDYAGGVLGAGDGVKIDKSESLANTLSEISKVEADGNYAGGIAGAVTAASGLGVLNETLGLAQALEFDIRNITVSVKEVKAGDFYAGGAYGMIAGGTTDHVDVNTIETVSAANYAGGYLGRAGATSIAEAGGLDILGLGVIEVNDLLSLGKILQAQVNDSSVTGNKLKVTTTENTEGHHYYTGGFVGENNSGKIERAHVSGLESVHTDEQNESSYAGGFAGCSRVGGLADIGTDDTVGGLLENGILDVDGLLNAVGYLIPEYTDCYVEFTDSDGSAPQVKGALAGGFIAEMQGGTIDNTSLGNDYAVRNAKYIEGKYYAGGFAGQILSGGLAQSDGLNVLGTSISIQDLLAVLEVYIPTVKSAGVSSEADEAAGDDTIGLKVAALEKKDTDADSGSAGGYVGAARGARISGSNVQKLATRTSSGKTLESADYAVQAPAYAGGYAGKIDIGSAAAAGDQLNLLGIVSLGNLTSALDTVESEFTSSDVYGKPGGFNVYSENGSAGGYVGSLEGSLLNDCDSYNFEYIEGLISAGGYAGTMQPGNVADLVSSADILGGLAQAKDILSLARTFIPRTWNSETTAVPCGGYVKAAGESADGTLKGLAGGYVGYNLGGQIVGNKTGDFEETVEQKTASAIRIRSVIGQEYAGGFTGLMQAANIADTGNLKLLWGLVEVSDIIQAAQAVYPTETATQVTGPLRDMQLDTWNAWVANVGKYGAYGDTFAEQTFENQEDLDAFLKDYIYGYTVETLAEDNGTGIYDGGSAGGYVGRMEGGVITDAHALDVKAVDAYRSAGGFAGEMITGTVANAGEIKLADLNLVNNIGLVDTFVPVIYSSSVTGYQSGMTVDASADSDNTAIGNAGGFAGYISGGQIWESKEEAESGDGASAAEGEELAAAARVENLRSVTSHKYAGGFAGVMEAGSAVDVDVQSENGLLNQILGQIITGEDIGALSSVLEATLPTVSSASVDGTNIVIDAEDGSHAKAAGGFVGMAKGAVIGTRDGSRRITVNNLKQIVGQKYAGGFAGIADVSGVAEIADNQTSILGIIGLENVDVLNTFRTYIYSADVSGTETGMFVSARKSSDGLLSLFSTANEVYKDGNAGGFAGSLLSATVLDSNVTNLAAVNAPNYSGGFAGMTGKSGVADVDNISVLDDLLDLSAGVVDLIGTGIENSTVSGISAGYTIKSSGGSEEIAGGFVGYGDLARISDCMADQLKQIYSDEISGGFIGKTNYAYLVQTNVGSSELLEPVLSVVNQLLEILYVDKLENLGLIQVTLPEPFSNVLNLQVLSEGDVLSVTLLGLKISVALSKGTGEDGTDVAQVHIGDSYIELPCHDAEDGKYVTDSSNIKVGLIKANRTKVVQSEAVGIASGYDVYGGGAGNDKDGTGKNGYAGGFVGYNNEGLLENNTMLQADTIRGTAGNIGEFSGASCLESNYHFNTLQGIEGENNIYYVYRLWDDDKLTDIYTAKGQKLSDLNYASPAVSTDGIAYYAYPVKHMEIEDIYKHADVWKGAYRTTVDQVVEFPVNVYVSDAQADLMLGTATEENEMTPGDETGEAQDPCDEEATLTIKKIWIDNNNSGDTRPDDTDGKDSIQITVTQDGEEYSADGITNPFVMTEDQETADPNVWVTTMKVPIYKRTDGGDLEKYEYAVSEQKIDGYTTVYNKSQDGYTLCIINFLQDELVKSDTVVIDFGLSVDVDVLTNDRTDEYGMQGKLTGVGVRGETEPQGKLAATAEGTYGTATVGPADADEETGSSAIEEGCIRYTPKNMEMDSYEKLIYAVELQNTAEDQKYVYGELNVVPATEIYYEDDFTAITYTDGTISQNPAEGLTEDFDYQQHGKWKILTDTENSTTSDVQDTDRPGLAEAVEGLKDANNLYGNDPHYREDHTYSNGRIHEVRVSALNSPGNGGSLPRAEFSFKGTGFDVISITSSDTGTLRVLVSNKDGTVQYDHTVHTYYGYKYENGSWIVDQNAADTLYQIPVIKFNDLPYDEYNVQIYPMYSKLFDVTGTTYYDLYIDAVRVYDPVDPDSTGEDYEFIEDIYNSDGENQPRFTQIRDILLNANNVAGVMNGSVFVDGNGAISDIKNYEAYGPKNEVYLSPRQAISFYLWTDYIPDKVQLAAKLAYNSQTRLGIALGIRPSETGSNEWQYFKVKEWNVNTAFDGYYEFTDNCIWREATVEDGVGSDGKPFKKYITKYPIVIANVSEADEDGENILSLTNLQWTGAGMIDEIDTPEVDTPAVYRAVNTDRRDIELLVTSTAENIAAAYYYTNPAIYSVSVSYEDETGKQVTDSYVKNGFSLYAPYDVTEEIGQIPDGYHFLRTEGDSVKGTVSGDMHIRVIVEQDEEESGSGTDGDEPGSGTDEGQPGSGTDEGQPGSGTDEGQPGSGTDEGQPGSGTVESRPESATEGSNSENGTGETVSGSGSNGNDRENGARNPAGEGAEKAVETGDAADPAIWILLVSAALCVLLLVGRRNQRK